MTFWQILVAVGGTSITCGLLMDTFGWRRETDEGGEVYWWDMAETWFREYADHLIRIGCFVVLAGMLAWALIG